MFPVRCPNNTGGEFRSTPLRRFLRNVGPDRTPLWSSGAERSLCRERLGQNRVVADCVVTLGVEIIEPLCVSSKLRFTSTVSSSPFRDEE